MAELNIGLINQYLKEIVPNIRQRGSDQPLGLIAWVIALKQNNNLILGLALKQGVGCSPFCGCAANQIGNLLEQRLRQKFPTINKMRLEATFPPPEIEEFWKN